MWQRPTGLVSHVHQRRRAAQVINRGDIIDGAKNLQLRCQKNRAIGGKGQHGSMSPYVHTCTNDGGNDEVRNKEDQMKIAKEKK